MQEQPSTTDKQPTKGTGRFGNGRPFAKGGNDPRINRAGRVPTTAEERRQKKLQAMARKELVTDLVSTLQPFARQAIEELAMLCSNPDPQLRLSSAQAILDRVFGKPVQQTQLSGGLGVTSDLRVIGPADIQAALLKLQAAHATDAVPVLKQPEAAPDAAAVAASLAVVDGVVRSQP